ncbi:MAG: hypothetical protein ACRES3_06475 [Steroidobacteraceae bacterium]
MEGKVDLLPLNASTGAYFGGPVTAGGDIAGRDQHKVVYGQPATIEDFTRLLAELRGLLAGARLDPDTKDAMDADFKMVEAQVQKPEPKRGLIEPKLKSIAGMLGSADQAAGATQGLIEKGAALAATLGALAAALLSACRIAKRTIRWLRSVPSRPGVALVPDLFYSGIGHAFTR